jgi:hypothetical protein
VPWCPAYMLYVLADEFLIHPAPHESKASHVVHVAPAQASHLGLSPLPEPSFPIRVIALFIDFLAVLFLIGIVLLCIALVRKLVLQRKSFV